MSKYHATGETDKGKHGGHKPKLITEEHCVFLRELMEEDCTVTLEYMQEQLEVVDGLRVGLTTIYNRIIGFHFSFKVIKKQCMAAVTEAVKEQRRQLPVPIAIAKLASTAKIYSTTKIQLLFVDF